MSQAALLEPKVVHVQTQSGELKPYIISKFPAIAGRRIISQYPLSALPKVGDYGVNEQTMLELMSYVAVPVEGGQLRLETAELINNHVPDWETLARLEALMLQHNTSFFKDGVVPGFIELFLERAAPILSRILTDSVRALSQMDSLPGSSSGKS